MRVFFAYFTVKHQMTCWLFRTFYFRFGFWYSCKFFSSFISPYSLWLILLTFRVAILNIPDIPTGLSLFRVLAQLRKSIPHILRVFWS